MKENKNLDGVVVVLEKTIFVLSEFAAAVCETQSIGSLTSLQTKIILKNGESFSIPISLGEFNNAILEATGL